MVFFMETPHYGGLALFINQTLRKHDADGKENFNKKKA